jgi:hypothetical protein
MGDPKSDKFFKHARAYFQQDVPGAEIILGKRTLADIIQTVNSRGKPVATLYVVSHANQAGNLQVSMDARDLKRDRATGDKKPRTEFDELQKANEEGRLPEADTALIDASTDIQIKGCNIGRSELMLEELEEAFGGEATVTAPTHLQEYRSMPVDGKMEREEFLSGYFFEEPGRSERSTAEVQELLKAKYPDVPEARWPKLLKALKRKDEKLPWGGYKGPRPPDDDEDAVVAAFKLRSKFRSWVLTYEGRTENDGFYEYAVRAERVTEDGTEWRQLAMPKIPIPPTDDELVEQYRATHGRPDAYEWTVDEKPSKHKVDSTVYIRRTEWTIRKTVEDESGPAHPSQDDPQFYTRSNP